MQDVREAVAEGGQKKRTEKKRKKKTTPSHDAPRQTDVLFARVQQVHLVQQHHNAEAPRRGRREALLQLLGGVVWAYNGVLREEEVSL